MESMDIEEKVKVYAKENLTKARYNHTKNVVEMAEFLAKKMGEKEGKARLAGWLHDALKEKKGEFHLQYIDIGDILYLNKFEKIGEIWHGFAAAGFAKEVFKIEDEEVLNAVKYHTVAREGMSKLEQILFISDMVSKERNYPGVEKLRELALEDFEEGFLSGLIMTIKKIVDKKQELYGQTLDAYHYYINNRNKKY